MEENWDDVDWNGYNQPAPVVNDTNFNRPSDMDRQSSRYDNRRDNYGSKYSNDRSRSSDNRSNRSNDRQNQRSSEYDDRRGGFDAEDSSHAIIDIDFGMAGKVIGSGGSQVRDMQDRYHVKVQVGEFVTPPNFNYQLYSHLMV